MSATSNTVIPGIGHNTETHTADDPGFKHAKNFHDFLGEVRAMARQEAKGKLTRAEFGMRVVRMASEHLISMANKGQHGKQIHAEWKKAFDEYNGNHSDYAFDSKSNIVQTAKINILIKVGVISAIDANDLMVKTHQIRQRVQSKLTPYDAMCAVAALQVKNPNAKLSEADIADRLTPKQKTKEELAVYKTLQKSMNKVAYGTTDENGNAKDAFKSPELLQAIKLIDKRIAELELRQAQEKRAEDDRIIAELKRKAEQQNIPADTTEETEDWDELEQLTAPGALDLQAA